MKISATNIVMKYFTKKDKDQFKVWSEIAKKEMANSPSALEVIGKWESSLCL